MPDPNAILELGIAKTARFEELEVGQRYINQPDGTAVSPVKVIAKRMKISRLMPIMR